MKQLILYILFVCTCSMGIAQSDWQELNPGAGGQVQDIIPDPNVDGRVFMVSDMEGVYRSDDSGETWYYTSDDLVASRTYTVCVDPDNSNRVYAATVYGLHYSDNAGINWTLTEETKGYSIGAIAVNPSNSNHIIAGQGWIDDYNWGGGLGTHDITSKGTLFISSDGGSSWNIIYFENDDSTDPNVFDIAFDPTSDAVYVATAKGLYKSNNGLSGWTLITPPANTYRCTGVDLDPTGNYMYVTYQTGTNPSSSPASLYASSTSSLYWNFLSRNGLSPDYLVWLPEVNKRSTPSRHKLIVPMLKVRDGLYECTLDWDGPRLTHFEWEHIWSGFADYDPGWEYTEPGPRVAHYTPESWSTEGIWSTINQSMHLGILQDNDEYNWVNKYCIKNTDHTFRAWGATQYTYESKGTVSTYTFDVAVHENYVVQGQADNGLMESWDYGVSWSNILGRVHKIYDARAVAIAEINGIPAVLAQGASAYGGNAREGRVYAKILNNHDPSDEWVLIGGGTESLGNLPNKVIQEISVDPANPTRVFIGYDDEGLYLINDLTSFFNGNSNAVKISPDSFTGVREVAFHPSDGNIVYVSAIRGSTGLYKGQWNSALSRWDWQRLITAGGFGAQVKSWRYSGTNYLLYTGKWQSGAPSGIAQGEYSAALSIDGGSSWTGILSADMIRGLRTNSWYDAIADIYDFDLGGVASKRNTIILSCYDHSMSKGYGVFKGTITGGTSVDWQDWSGEFHFKGGTDSEIYQVDGKDFYYTGTQGVGMWRRDVSAGGLSDTLFAVTAPNEVVHGSTVSVYVEYEAAKDRKVRVTLEDYTDGYKRYGEANVIVSAGTGTVPLQVEIDQNAPPHDSYQWQTILTETDGAWHERKDNIHQRGISILAPARANIWYLKNKATGKYARPGSEEDDAHIIVSAEDGSDWFQWEKVETSEGYFYLKNLHTGKYFRPIEDVDGSLMAQKPTSWDGTWTQWTENLSSDGLTVHLVNRKLGKHVRPQNGNENSALELRPSSWSGDWTRWTFESEPSNGRDADVSSVKTNERLLIYPNPVYDELSIENAETAIEIVNLTGVVLMEFEKSKRLDVSNLKPGLYLIRANGITTKFVKRPQ